MTDDEANNCLGVIRAATAEIATLRAQVKYWIDAWAAAQVKTDTMPDPSVAVCIDCGVVARCDDDRCCLTCGRDLVIVADRHSADVLCSRNEEPFPMAPSALGTPKQPE